MTSKEFLRRCLFILWLLQLGFSLCHSKPGYVFTAPKILQRGFNETFCFTFHELTENIDVKIRLVDNQRVISETDHFFLSGKGECFKFPVPTSVTENREHEVEIVGMSESKAYEFESRGMFLIKQPRHYILLLQTDKSIYKPAQTVRLRLMVLDVALKPVKLPVDEVSDTIILEDPQEVRYMQWKHLRSLSGLLTHEFQLSDEPPLGIWQLTAEIGGVKHTTRFTVDEYVLPKYEVTVTPPKFVSVFTPVIAIDVCAKYTYGEPVKGTLVSRICLKQLSRYSFYYYNQERLLNCQTKYDQIDGCKEVLISGEQLGLPYSNYSVWGARVIINVTVTETTTGVSLWKSEKINRITKTELQLEFVDTVNHYKPGLPFYGKVKIFYLDGTPAPHETIEVKVLPGTFKQNLMSDLDGFIHLNIHNFTNSGKGLDIVATAIRYVTKWNIPEQYHSMDTPRAVHSIKPWFSPSNSFIGITPVGRTVACGITVPITLVYTTLPGSDVIFHYEVTSRGHIVEQGSHRHQNGLDSRATLTPLSIPKATKSRSQRKSLHAKKTWISPAHRYYQYGTPLLVINNKLKEADKKRLMKYRKATSVARFTFDLDIRTEYSPVSRILVYFVNGDEIVADSLSLDVEECFNNTVTMEFSDMKVKPGADVSLMLTADPHSVCGIGVVDKSVLLLGGDNQITPKKVFDMISSLDVTNSGYWWNYLEDYCKKRYTIPNRDRYADIFMYNKAHSDFQDSGDVFRDLNMLTITDLELDTKPCYYSGLVLESGIPSPSRKMQSDAVKVRKNFPETWLWQLAEIGSSGELTLDQQIPDTITQWVGNALCTNPQSGFGISPKTSVTVVKSLFVSFTAPYSMIRGEQVPLIVSVFNYLKTCLTVVLDIDKSWRFDLVGATSEVVCVCGGETYGHRVVIVARDIGQIDVTARVRSTNRISMCSGDQESVYADVSDAMVKSVIVEPEGLPVERTVSNYICPHKETGVYSRAEELTLPEDVIGDSVRAYVTVIGNVMGSSLEGLGSLVRLPTGCGEQTASSLAPNIYVMQYLHATGKLTDPVGKMLIKNMEHGRQRMLGYRTKEGAYSVWKGKSPSMWLTLFTIKSFANSAKYVFIDEGDLQLAINWVGTRQLPDGCLPVTGYNHGWGKAAGKTPGDVTLTAYGVIAMLEADCDKDSGVIVKALSCIRNISVSDTYTLTLAAYAFSLYDPSSDDTLAYVKKLRDSAVKSESLIHWERQNLPTRPSYKRYSSAEIEMTAYALLTLLTQPPAAHDLLPIVNWISKQRNAYGGFSSTQDTVLALQALAGYASTSDAPVNLNVMVNSDLEFHVTVDNQLLLQKRTLKMALPGQLNITAVGTGCALLQVDIRFNIPNVSPPSPAFNLAQETITSAISEESCKTRQIKACTKYTGLGSMSGMAILEVTMVTGWQPVEATVAENVNRPDLSISKHEIKDNQAVVFYFDSVGKFDHCVQFSVVETVKVSNVQDARLHIYDYYNTEMSNELAYNLGDCHLWLPTIQPVPFFVDIPPQSNVLTPMSETNFEKPVLDIYKIIQGIGLAVPPNVKESGEMPTDGMGTNEMGTDAMRTDAMGTEQNVTSYMVTVLMTESHGIVNSYDQSHEITTEKIFPNGMTTGEMANNENATNEKPTNRMSTAEMVTSKLMTDVMDKDKMTTGEMATNMRTDVLISTLMATKENISGELTTVGIATGDSIIEEKATGEMTTIGIATGELTSARTTSHQLTTDGMATGEHNTVGMATGEHNTVGMATGEQNTVGMATGEHNTVGMATGEHNTVGMATGEHNTVGMATGEHNTVGMATGEHNTVGMATGEQNTVGMATGEHNTVGMATGEHNTVGMATGEHNTVGMATGEHNTVGMATGEHNTVGMATGEHNTVGMATGEHNTVGMATGEHNTVGMATGEHNTVGMATGEHNTVGMATGEQNTVGMATGEQNTVGMATGEQNTVGMATGEQNTDGMATGDLSTHRITTGSTASKDMTIGDITTTPMGYPDNFYTTKSERISTRGPITEMPKTTMSHTVTKTVAVETSSNNANPDYLNTTVDSQTKAEKVMPHCPICVDSVAKMDLKDAFCSSKYAYKTLIKSGEYTLKIQANLRPPAKETIGKLTRYTMDAGCRCDVISDSRKVIILSMSRVNGESLRLDAATVVIKYVRGIDKRMKEYSRLADCVTHM